MVRKHKRFFLITEQPDIERAMLLYQIPLGKDLQSYKNHVYRMYNYAAWYVDYDKEELTKLAVAAAFHDIGIWTHNTFDYLGPSEQTAMQYIERYALPEEWNMEVALIIERHHQIGKYEGGFRKNVEAFRKADLADLTKGLARGKLPFAAIEQALEAFPYLGFHGLLIKLTLQELLQNPFNPLPMVRWRK